MPIAWLLANERTYDRPGTLIYLLIDLIRFSSRAFAEAVAFGE